MSLIERLLHADCSASDGVFFDRHFLETDSSQDGDGPTPFYGWTNDGIAARAAAVEEDDRYQYPGE